MRQPNKLGKAVCRVLRQIGWIIYAEYVVWHITDEQIAEAYHRVLRATGYDELE